MNLNFLISLKILNIFLSDPKDTSSEDEQDPSELIIIRFLFISGDGSILEHDSKREF